MYVCGLGDISGPVMDNRVMGSRVPGGCWAWGIGNGAKGFWREGEGS